MRKLTAVVFGLFVVFAANDCDGLNQKSTKILRLVNGSSAAISPLYGGCFGGGLEVFPLDGHRQYADSLLPTGFRVRWVNGLELPQLNSVNDKVIRKTGFSLLYNEVHEQASWVAYQLTQSETQGFVERTDNFREDPMVKTGSATSADYQGSGYDRGHLAPAGDMGWSSLAMSESFYYSNMSPQVPAFNRGIWKRLEEQVRSWAVDYDTLYVVTGPVLTADLSKIGPNQVSVPRYYYKVLLDYSEPQVKGIGFVMPNMGLKLPLQNYAVSIDSVERLTGINFFPKLVDNQEEIIEKTVCLSCWNWGSLGGSSQSSVSGSGNSSVSAPRHPAASGAVQCSGITQSGVRCKRRTTSLNGRCYQHQ